MRVVCALFLAFACVALLAPSVVSATRIDSVLDAAELEAVRLHRVIAAWPKDEIMPLLAVPEGLVPEAVEDQHAMVEQLSAIAVSGDADQEHEVEQESLVDAEVETQVEAEAEAEAEAETEAETETEAATETATETEATAEVAVEAEAEAEVESTTESESTVVSDAGAEADAESEARAEVASATDAEVAVLAAASQESEVEVLHEAEAGLEAEVSAALAAEAESLAAAGLDANMMTEAESAVTAEHYAGVRWTSSVKGAGCGSGATERLVPDWNMQNACLAHDACYDTCSSKKTNCDNTFYSNMQNLCAKKYAGSSVIKKAGLKLCNGQAYLYYKAVVLFGADPFSAAQTATCKTAKIAATAAAKVIGAKK